MEDQVSTPNSADEDEAELLVYSVPEAGGKIGLGKCSSYNAVRNGDIPAVKIGGRWIVPKVAFDRMLANVGVAALLPAAEYPPGQEGLVVTADA